MGSGRDYYEDENPEKTRKGALVRKILGFVFLVAIIAGAAVGIYLAAHGKKKKDNSGSSDKPDPTPAGPANHSYPDALKLSVQFFDVQKSGKLPKDYSITWRGDSAVTDGSDVGLDLSGGLYDAGDHMKFSFTMAFTATVLSWTVLEYSVQLQDQNQLNATKDKIRWVTNFLIKAHPEANVFYHQVGDPDKDHACWERSSDMLEERPSSNLTTTVPGSDVAGEAAAALAAASLVFSSDDPTYSIALLTHAKQLFTFGDTYRGKYTDSYPADKIYYNSTGYGDELLWAAAWLYHATGDDFYMNYVLGDEGTQSAQWGRTNYFSWDQKLPGVQVLLTRKYLLNPLKPSSENNVLRKYKTTADQVMCALLPSSPTATKSRTKGGLIWLSDWNSVEHSVNAAFLALIYSDYLKAANGTLLSCSGTSFTHAQVRDFASSQSDYILGKNPEKISYLVGYGSSYPQFVHHRDASIKTDGKTYGCKEGFDLWFYSASPNPNVAYGALVGGPALNETFTDSRQNIQQNEPSTYNSASMTGLIAGLSFPIDSVVSWTTLSGV